MNNAVKYLPKFVNRNPRNAELMRLQRKPDGWDFEKNQKQKNFIYRFNKLHSLNLIVLTGSTSMPLRTPRRRQLSISKMAL